MSPNYDPLLLAGATATGKSGVAMLLAEKLGGEIISVDSMQVYRGMDIGTAKPGPAERRRVLHHLIDVVGVDEPFDAARFSRLAHDAVCDIQSRGRVPILCGGTGLYFKAFLEGLGDAPPANVELRAELEAAPLTDILRELEVRDPATFAVIDRSNPRRVIRALEVICLTGKPFSSQRATWSSDKPPCAFFGLSRSNADLHERINERVDRMFKLGLIAEVRELMKQGLGENKTAMQAIGYRQVAVHLRGERSLGDTIALVKTRTRQFAKRQLTWFRRHAGLNWIECAPGESPEAIAKKISR